MSDKYDWVLGTKAPDKSDESKPVPQWIYFAAIVVLVVTNVLMFARLQGCTLPAKPDSPPAVKSKASQITILKTNEGRTDIALEGVVAQLTAKYGPIVRLIDHDPKNAAGETPRQFVEAVAAAAGKDSVVVEGKDGEGNVVILLNEPLPSYVTQIPPMVEKVMTQ
jgi:hypothetical protein